MHVLKASWKSHNFFFNNLSDLQLFFVTMLFFKKERLKISIMQ